MVAVSTHWFVWLEEYPDEGSIIVEAPTLEEAFKAADPILVGEHDPADVPPPLNACPADLESLERRFKLEALDELAERLRSHPDHTADPMASIAVLRLVYQDDPRMKLKGSQA